jgi:uncharacterized membrane protein YdbT with pleckstrin-like domain
MSYLEKSLAADEVVVVRGDWPTIHWIGAWAALLFLGIFVVGIVIFLRSWAVMSTTEFAVTNRRVVLKRGWFNTSTQELAVESVEGVRLTQSFWGKIFGYGHVVVTGTGDASIVFPPMAHPVTFRRAIEAGRGRSNEVHLAQQDRDRIDSAQSDNALPEDRSEDRGSTRRERSRRFIGLGTR